MEKSWFGDAIRAIIAQLDKVIYALISVFYDIIIKLAEINVFKEGAFEETASRLYTLIGLFMLFKVSFSFINYIINPDSLNDKEKGGGNLIKHIVVSFVMIIITPFCFNLLTEAQSAILKDQIIPNFILGTNWEEGSGNTFKISEDCPNGVQITNVGDYIALMTIFPFYQLETEEGYDQSKREELISNSNYCSATKVKELLNGDIYKSGKKDGLYTVSYNIFISTAVGVVVALLFLGYCMDVSVRAIKLGFLEIISPIPIISYIDPGKSASGMFKKWLSEVGRTWASLFIRLIAVFFAIFIISNIDYGNITGDNSWYITLFIIIGALIFAKQLPKLIENILGIKLDGGFQLNPLKKVSSEALGGKIATAGLVAGGVGAAGAIAAGRNKFKAYRDTGHGMLSSIGAGAIGGGVGGFFRTAGRTVMTGSDGSLKGMKNAMKTGFASAGHSASNVYSKEGTSLGGRTAASLQRAMGLKTAHEITEEELKSNDNIASKLKSITDTSKEELNKNRNYSFQYKGSNINYAAKKAEFESKLNAKVVSDADRASAISRIAEANSIMANANSSSSDKQYANSLLQTYSEIANGITAAEKVAMQKELDDLDKAANNSFLNEIYRDPSKNAKVANSITELNIELQNAKGTRSVEQFVSDVNNGVDYSEAIKDAMTNISNEKMHVRSSAEYAINKANNEYSQRNKKG